MSHVLHNAPSAEFAQLHAAAVESRKRAGSDPTPTPEEIAAADAHRQLHATIVEAADQVKRK